MYLSNTPQSTAESQENQNVEEDGMNTFKDSTEFIKHIKYMQLSEDHDKVRIGDYDFPKNKIRFTLTALFKIDTQRDSSNKYQIGKIFTDTIVRNNSINQLLKKDLKYFLQGKKAKSTIDPATDFFNWLAEKVNS